MKTYKSKIGLELIIPLFLIFSWSLFELVSKKAWSGILIMLLPIVFILHTILSINYKIEKET
jgi:phosphoglycerol transferase MdoB-like AlkP superfamily enzyme